MKYLPYIAFILLMVGCNTGPKTIPEDEFKNIIKDLLITDAVMSSNNSFSRNLSDSIDYYQPVFDKYGYTQADVYYTARQLAARKSKPLANIFEDILFDLNSITNRVHYIYDRKLKWDTIAEKFYTDTIFRCDTLVSGSTSKIKFVVNNPIKGFYTFIFNYQGHKQYSLPLRQAIGTLTYRDKALKPIIQRQWVSRSFTVSKIKLDVNVSDSSSYDSLIFTIDDPDYKEQFSIKDDTSKTSRIRILYEPKREDARKEYFSFLTGIRAQSQSDKIIRDNDSILYKWYYSVNEKDSCTLGPVGRR